YNIIKSPRSYNSQIGVPISVWQMKEANNLAIFEAGISEPGEMENLEKIIRPTIGILTSIGDAHAAGFKDIEEKIEEKLKLFFHSKAIIYCSDDALLNTKVENFLKAANEEILLFNWGKKGSPKLLIKNIKKLEGGSIITC